jgi:hypothetical protein
MGCSPYRAEDAAPTPAPERDAQPAEKDAVYVAPTGRDFAEGTKDAPVATIARALVLSSAHGGADIVVCASTYDENVVIDRPVRIVGNRSCADFGPGAGPARFETVAGITITIANAKGVTLEDIVASAHADHTQPGSSAVALFVSRASEVTLRHVDLRAGPGSDGPDGAARTNHDGASAGRGGDAASNAGGAGASCTCIDGSSSKGGSGSGALGVASSGTSSATTGAANAGRDQASSCTVGQPGAPAGGGAASPGSTTSPILVTAAAIDATRGGDGANGSVAQGGGGGGRDTNLASGGGGGGCGGCGGGGGRGGASGGSSLALVSFESQIVIEESTLAASAGGNGGRGADGQLGQPGGAGGAPSVGACSGGSGGSGGAGAGGGGGAGGHSIGILHVGPMPSTKATTISITTAGAAGIGGDGEARGADGSPGIAAEVFTP